MITAHRDSSSDGLSRDFRCCHWAWSLWRTVLDTKRPGWARARTAPADQSVKVMSDMIRNDLDQGSHSPILSVTRVLAHVIAKSDERHQVGSKSDQRCTMCLLFRQAAGLESASETRTNLYHHVKGKSKGLLKGKRSWDSGCSPQAGHSSEGNRTSAGRCSLINARIICHLTDKRTSAHGR